jgi:hypothetical protein
MDGGLVAEVAEVADSQNKSSTYPPNRFPSIKYTFASGESSTRIGLAFNEDCLAG